MILQEAYPDFRAALRAAVRGLWMRALTLDQFLDAFGAAIDRGLTQAWIEGAGECGIAFDELSGEERARLQQFIIIQRLYMGRFGEKIDRMSDPEKKDKRALAVLFDQTDMWANRYNEVRNVAAGMACGDKKKRWVMNLKRPTKVHCVSCSTFHGRVYRYSTWLANNALPQSRALQCGGYRCGCGFEDTDDRITPGRFPSSVLG